MGIEIERKFLVSEDSWKATAGPGNRFCQGSLARQTHASVRVRRASDRAYLTVKGPKTGISRPEFEYEIPVDEAEEMLSRLCAGPLIEKTRYCVAYGDAVWEIDVYAGQADGLVIAEVELESADTALTLAPWVGIEVTNDARFHNSSIGREPQIAIALAASARRKTDAGDRAKKIASSKR